MPETESDTDTVTIDKRTLRHLVDGPDPLTYLFEEARGRVLLLLEEEDRRAGHDWEEDIPEVRDMSEALVRKIALEADVIVSVVKLETLKSRFSEEAPAGLYLSVQPAKDGNDSAGLQYIRMTSFKRRLQERSIASSSLEINGLVVCNYHFVGLPVMKLVHSIHSNSLLMAV